MLSIEGTADYLRLCRELGVVPFLRSKPDLCLLEAKYPEPIKGRINALHSGGNLPWAYNQLMRVDAALRVLGVLDDTHVINYINIRMLYRRMTAFDKDSEVIGLAKTLGLPDISPFGWWIGYAVKVADMCEDVEHLIFTDSPLFRLIHLAKLIRDEDNMYTNPSLVYDFA